MPTGNEYSDVRFGGGGDQSYKQTDREMSGGVDGQAVGLGPQPFSGQYPNTFDASAGSETNSPDYYPQSVFSDVSATGPGQAYTSHGGSVGGEYGQVNPSMTLGKFTSGDNIVPDTIPSKQLSSDKTGDPKVLVRQNTSSIDAHSNLMESFGYRQPIATLGSHPWLRDELAITTELEPGNAEPKVGIKIPQRSLAGE